eukprot:TRINITY_DN18750_c0_g1_i1.p1 TRINITY_DN18750_c0_g1~~TRINITY_DN18750_c0_g1_i1.p1  ORF type:complete len:282 (+),score=44.65 TRINITY_DN18750_c0_g1_i1:252-1097(+)
MEVREDDKAVYVVTKIPALLACEHRPLKAGETPKRPGQTTLYEATGSLDPEFEGHWGNKEMERYVTVKHDGMCSFIEVREGTMRIYKRYDVRKGNKAPPGALPSAKNLKGEVEFYWIDVTDSTDAGDQYFQAAVVRTFDRPAKQITALHLIVPQPGGHSLQEVPVEKIQSGTYELVGPKVQSNRYSLPTDLHTSVKVSKKGNLSVVPVPRHYFVQHGAFRINEIFYEQVGEKITVEAVKKFIISHGLEGVVVHFSNKKSWKVNRGHIGEDLNQTETLRISL